VVGTGLIRQSLEGDLALETLTTLGRLAAAFALAAVTAVPLGLLMGRLRALREALDPYVAFLFPVPKIAMLPFLLILLGVGEPAFVLTGAISAFFQITISTLGGVSTMDPRLLEVGRNYGAEGARLFRKVILPAALPSIFTGLRLGLGLALVTIVAVEFITAKSGLGHLVYRHWQMLSTVEMYGAFVLVGALGLLLTRGLGALQRRTLAWQEESATL
jgi:ABC-type nitrate/sulfonate/bicarbonate transport system permease component